jgi:hypothetical protein
MKVRCDICFETIAEVSRSFLSFPMTGAMFKSPDPHHGFSDPFPTSAHWDDFRCPYGNHRPFINIDSIMTDEGVLVLPLDGSKSHFQFEEQVKEPLTTPMADLINTTNKYIVGINKQKKEVQDERKTTGELRDGRKESKEAKGREEKHTCEVCKKEFEKEINLKRHARMAHK